MSISEQFLALGEALRALEDYNRDTSKSLRVQIAELRNMITVLTQTVIVVSASNGTSVARLQEIEKALKRPGLGEDMHSVNVQLGECLLQVRGDAVRQKAEGRVALESPQKELAESQEQLGGWSERTSPDLASQEAGPELRSTRLPDKAEALKGLQEAAAAPHTKFLLLAVIDSLQAVNARFGYASGDQVIAVAAEHFRSSLLAEDKLYRWHSSAPERGRLVCRSRPPPSSRCIRHLVKHAPHSASCPSDCGFSWRPRLILGNRRKECDAGLI